MTDASDSSRFRRLGRAVQAYLAHCEAPDGSREDLLGRNDDVRDLLEPLLEASGEPEAAGNAAAPERLPRFFGGFRLVREVGRGGMGVVYEAEEFALGRRVALKVLPNQPGVTARQIERFRREAAAAARLRHPGIVPVYSVGEVDGTHWFAMEYVDGRSLGQALAAARTKCGGDPARLRGGDLGCVPDATSFEAEAVEVLAQAAEAVAAAHAGGVLHRDLKPHNILVDREGRVRVVDFGLAKDLERGSISRSGDVAGTPFYMSPEQAQGGRGVDARTDVYALGVVLYELLTLRVPFSADTPHAVLHEVLTRDPESPRRSNPRLPRDLETICLKAMERDAAYRYRTAGALAEELRRFQRMEPIEARPPGSVTRLVKFVRRRKAVALASLLGFLVVVVGPLAFALYQQSVHRELATQEQATARERDRARTNFSRARRLLEQQLERVEQLGREPGMEVVHRQMAEDTLAYYREFLAVEPKTAEDAELERQALQTHLLVARIYMGLGEDARAVGVLDTAVAHIERRGQSLADLLPEVLRNRSAARLDAGDSEGGKADLAAAIALETDQLAQATDAGVQRRAQLGLANSLLQDAGRALQLGERSAEAWQKLTRAMELLRVAPVDTLPAIDRELTMRILRRRGELLRRTGRDAEAEAEVREAVRLARALSAVADAGPGDQEGLASVLGEHAVLLSALRRGDEAEAMFREAIALDEELVQRFPRTQVHRHGLEVQLTNYGNLLRGQKKYADAVAALRRAEAVNEELVAQSPETVIFAVHLCTVSNLRCLTETEGRLVDAATMHADYLQATARHEAMVQAHPGVIALQSALGAVLSNHGQWLIGERRMDEAQPLLDRAIAAQRVAFASDPAVAQYRSFLYKHLTQLGRCELARRNGPAAAGPFGEAAELYPDSARTQVTLARLLVECAALTRTAGDATAASGVEDAAMRLLERGVRVDADEAKGLAQDAGFAPLRGRADFRALTGAPR